MKDIEEVGSRFGQKRGLVRNLGHFYGALSQRD